MDTDCTYPATFGLYHHAASLLMKARYCYVLYADTAPPPSSSHAMIIGVILCLTLFRKTKTFFSILVIRRLAPVSSLSAAVPCALPQGLRSSLLRHPLMPKPPKRRSVPGRRLLVSPHLSRFGVGNFSCSKLSKNVLLSLAESERFELPKPFSLPR